MSASYTYAAAYVKALESDMLTDAEFESLIGLSEREFFDFLKNRGYSGDNLSDMLENEQAKTHKICTELCGGDSICDIFSADRNFHNIKTVIKAVFSQSSAKELLYTPSDVDCDKLAAALKSGDFSEADFSEIAQSAADICKRQGFRQTEIYLNRRFFEYITAAAGRNRFVRGWVDLRALCTNLKILFKNPENAAEALVPCSALSLYAPANSANQASELIADMGYFAEYALFQKSPAQAEKFLDDKVTEYLKSAHADFFTLNSVFGYFFGKRTEIINLRLIYYGNKNGTEKEKIAERLRESYV